MAGFGDLVQKAFYLGVGIASYAGEKAGSTLSELRSQAQKLAEEMVARGEITAEEAKRLVDEMVNRAQQQQEGTEARSEEPSREPRRIEILDDESDSSGTTSTAGNVDDLRQQVEKLQDELRRLRNQ